MAFARFQKEEIMNIFFYSKKGKAIVFQKDNFIFSLKGKPLAFIKNNAIFSFKAKHLGYFQDGWIRDKKNNAVMYSDNHSGTGPIPPIHEIAPIPYIPSIPPIPLRPHKSYPH